MVKKGGQATQPILPTRMSLRQTLRVTPFVRTRSFAQEGSKRVVDGSKVGNLSGVWVHPV